MGTFADDLVNGWLAAVADTCWVSLHFDDPATAGAYASEYSGDGYKRVLAHFSNVTNRAIWNANALQFTGLDAGTITHLGGWNASLNGDLLFSTELPAPVRLTRGQGFTVNSEQLALSLD